MNIVILFFAISSSLIAVYTFKKSMYFATRELLDRNNAMTRYWFVGIACACLSLATFSISLGCGLGTLCWLLLIGSHLTAIFSLPSIFSTHKKPVKQSAALLKDDSNLFDDLVV
ncbi:hypothetical protein [Pseudoalteromonas denitrificans]|uniref:Uncharacterized protein n=1 Tax=Pseudoalteromonas denitrificans DSM 6059 TaxID=1123010 RepID=A0A1I1E6D2_9GAMM|nr:hypothetical protein [Pseudoalteromonas denitrificans]SFB82192.1 hypothetical protein SAMN02745724_00220 [Pseudoalteromonas denitrificans DSM 6059]